MKMPYYLSRKQVEFWTIFESPKSQKTKKTNIVDKKHLDLCYLFDSRF